jgi:hypothetical protein
MARHRATRGTRPFIRDMFACEPDGCGAQPGARCIAYVAQHGKTTGKPTEDVHAARWRAFHAWLAGRQQAEP